MKYLEQTDLLTQKVDQWLLGPGGTANGNRVSFGADKNILNLDCGDGCITL